MNRLWDSDEDNLSPHIHPIKASVKKPSAKGVKAKPVEKISVEQLLQELENTSFSIFEQPYGSLFDLYNREFLQQSVSKQLIDPDALALAGDGTPFVTSARERKHRVCDCASRHDSHGFLHAFFRMRSFLPEFNISKLLLDSAHDAMPVYQYCKRNGITPFIDLNEKRGIKVKYKNNFTIGKDGVPVCKEGLRMNHDGSEPAKHRLKYRCPLASRKYGCSCEHPCSDSKYGRTVHLATKDNPRLINIPPRDSDEWKKEFNARTSAERSNKREKYDFLLESGRHRSTKMWYCRLYHIMMLQHLDAWDLPFESTPQKLILEVA